MRRNILEVLALVIVLCTASAASGQPAEDSAISGTCLGTDQQPLVGAEVIAELALRWTEEPTLEAMIQTHERRTASRMTTRTDSDGLFCFSNLTAGSDYVVVIPEFPQTNPADSGRRVARPGQMLRFTAANPLASPLAFKQVRVVTTITLDDRVVDHATVAASDFGGRPLAWNRVDRSSWFVVGRPSRVKATAHGVFASDEIDVVIESSVPARPIELSLRPVTSLHGRFVGPGSHIGLRLRSSSPIEGPPPPSIHGIGHTWRSIPYAQGSGVFHLVDITPGPYVIQAVTGRDPTVVREWPIDVVPGFQLATLRYELSADHDFILNVIDNTGQPVPGLSRVVIWTRWGENGQGQGNPTPMREVGAGRYGVSVDPEQRVRLVAGEVHTVSLRVEADDLGVGTVHVEPAHWRGVHQIVLPAYGSISMHVEDYIGSGYEGRIRVWLDSSDNWRSASYYTDKRIPGALGTGSRAELRHGRYHVVASCTSEHFKQDLTYFRHPVDVNGNHTHVTIPLPESFLVQVRFPEDLVGSRMILRQHSIHNRVLTRGDATREMQWSLTAGEYRISAGGTAMNFRLPGPQVLDFQETLYRRARVTGFMRRGMHLFELGIRRDDLVVAIDGQPFATDNPQLLLKSSLDHNGRARITIQRGELLEVELNSANMSGAQLRLIGVLGPE